MEARTRIGLVAFSGFAAMVQEPTADAEAMTDAIRSLRTGRRTAMGNGILVSIDAIAESQPDVARSYVGIQPRLDEVPNLPEQLAPAIIVVLTDGASNAGTDPLIAAQQAADRGIRVYTIDYGSPTGGEMDPVCREQFIGREPGSGGGFGGGGGGGRFRRAIDEETPTAVADLTGGTYFPAESADELSEVFAGLPTTTIRATEPMEVSALFVGLGAALGGVALLLGRAWRPPALNGAGPICPTAQLTGVNADMRERSTPDSVDRTLPAHKRPCQPVEEHMARAAAALGAPRP